MSDTSQPLTTPPPRLRLPSLARFAAYLLLMVCLVTSAQAIDLSLADLLRGIPNMGRIVGEMVSPNIQRVQAMARALLETFQMAFVGSVLGVALSFPLAVDASRPHTPHVAFYHGARLLVSLFRTVPDLVWALFFVASVGLGPFAGALALMVDTIGFCGRFFAEAMEEVDHGPQEALEALGANRYDIVMSAVLPAAMPSFHQY
jgi:phosphonate transport system permease protein